MTPGDERHRDELSHQFGDNIRRYRERKNMTQTDLAQEMTKRGWQWHQQTVYKIEHGNRRTEGIEVHDLADVLGVSMDRLFWAGAEANETAATDAAIATIRRAYRETSEATTRFLHAIASGQRMYARAKDSKYERVRNTATELAAEIEVSTLEAAVNDGIDKYETFPEP